MVLASRNLSYPGTQLRQMRPVPSSTGFVVPEAISCCTKESSRSSVHRQQHDDPVSKGARARSASKSQCSCFNAPARYILLSTGLKSNDIPPVFLLIKASRSTPTPLRSAATVAAAAAAFAPEPAGSPGPAEVGAALPLLFGLALADLCGTRLSVIRVECSKPLAMVHALTLPSVEIETNSSSRSGPLSIQRTCS